MRIEAPVTVTEHGERTDEGRQQTARRLLASAARTSFDPTVDVDWAAPPVPGAYYLPAHRSSLYGTALWSALSEAERIELTKYEVASIATAGIWFETILMQMLVRHVYERGAVDPHMAFAFTEIADECRHSTMFGRMVETLGCQLSQPEALLHQLGKGFAALSNGPLTFAGPLFVEELLDAFQREMMADPDIQPLVRQVSRIHVIEEARHLRYAGEELAREWATQSRRSRIATRMVLAGVCQLAIDVLIQPSVYAAVGLDPARARRVAAHNPYWRASRRWAARKAVARFDGLGMLGGPGLALWARAGLLPVRNAPE